MHVLVVVVDYVAVTAGFPAAGTAYIDHPARLQDKLVELSTSNPVSLDGRIETGSPSGPICWFFGSDSKLNVGQEYRVVGFDSVPTQHRCSLPVCCALSTSPSLPVRPSEFSRATHEKARTQNLPVQGTGVSHSKALAAVGRLTGQQAKPAAQKQASASRWSPERHLERFED